MILLMHSQKIIKTAKTRCIAMRKHNEAHYLPGAVTTVNNCALTARLSKVTLPFVCRTFKSTASSHVSFILITCSLPPLPPHFSPTVQLHPRSPLCFSFFSCVFLYVPALRHPSLSLNCGFTADCSLFLSLSPALPPVQVHRTEWLATLRLPPSPHSEYCHANFTDRHCVENFRGRGLLFPRSALICFGGGQSKCVWCMRGKKGKNGDRKRRREQNSCVIVRVLRVELWEIDTSLDWGYKSCAVCMWRR